MSVEFGNTPSSDRPASIEPFLNPTYWDGRFIGDGTAQPQQEREESVVKALFIAGRALNLYARQRESRLASSRLHTGDVFDVDDYSEGTILLTLSERLSCMPKAKDIAPMTEFQDVPIPNRLTGIVDGEQELEGHGYQYEAIPFVNAIIGNNKRKVLLISEAVLDSTAGLSGGEFGRVVVSKMIYGVERYTVGDVYAVGNKNKPYTQALLRVTEAIVCIGGGAGRKTPSLKERLIEQLGGSLSSAANPAES